MEITKRSSQLAVQNTSLSETFSKSHSQNSVMLGKSQEVAAEEELRGSNAIHGTENERRKVFLRGLFFGVLGCMYAVFVFAVQFI